MGVLTGIIALAGMATAFAAIKQARAVECSNEAFLEAQKIAVTPHLDIEHGHSPVSSNYFELANNGLGPAEILEFVIYVDGVPVDPSAEYGGWHLVGKKLGLPDNFAHVWAPGIGSWIRPNQKEQLFGVEKKIGGELAYSEFGRIRGHIGFRILYRSRYGEEKELRRNLEEHVG